MRLLWPAMLVSIATAFLLVASVSAQVVPDDFLRGLTQATPAAPGPQQPAGLQLGPEAAAPTDQAAATQPEDEAQENKTRYWIFVHAVLMSVAWVGLLPRE